MYLKTFQFILFLIMGILVGGCMYFVYDLQTGLIFLAISIIAGLICLLSPLSNPKIIFFRNLKREK